MVISKSGEKMVISAVGKNGYFESGVGGKKNGFLVEYSK